MGRPRGSKNKPKVAEVALPEVAPEQVVETASTTEEKPRRPRIKMGRTDLEQKLDHFQYTNEEEALKMWEYGKDTNPLKLPAEIKKSYPHMRFRWVSRRMWDKYGKNHNGWQQFKDKTHQDGVTRGNDLFLCAIPEDVARKREDFFREQSSEKIKDIQRKAISTIEEIEASGGEAIGSPEQLAKGIVIGRRPKFGKGGDYQRGLQAAMVEEVIAKNREKMAKNRKYFT